jgi:probable F420-dependent oxidoreductase
VPKVLVGALGPRMTQMAAEVADGIQVMPFNSPRHVEERTLPAIERGLAATGRARADLELTFEVIVAVGRDERELETARSVRTLLAFYGSTPAYRPVLEAHGWGDLQPELNALSKRGDWSAMNQLVTDEMLETIAVVGTPDQCAAEIAARYGGHADRICAYFPYYDAPDDLLAAFTDSFRAVVRESRE